MKRSCTCSGVAGAKDRSRFLIDGCTAADKKPVVTKAVVKKTPVAKKAAVKKAVIAKVPAKKASAKKAPRKSVAAPAPVTTVDTGSEFAT